MSTYTLQPLNETAERIAHRAYPFFAASFAVGLLSMAVIQVFKDLLPLRRWFQRSWVLRWLDEKHHHLLDTKKARTLIGDSNDNFSSSDAESQLIQLAADGDSKAFYNLPIEQLCGQLNSAAQAALEHPSDYKVLLLHLGARAEEDDLTRVVADTEKFKQTPPPVSGESAGQSSEKSDRDSFQKFVDARNRMAHQIQRAIDALQVSSGQRWKLWIQIIALALSFIIALLSITFFGDVSGAQKIEMVVAVTIMGGFLAPVARDLIAGLQALRK